MEKSRCRKVYFFTCLVCLIGLSSVRSPPVYGKLDFLLLDGHPWWRPWHAMIEQVIAQGEQPIITDLATSTVLRAVFAQKTVAFRGNRQYTHLDVDALVEMNRGEKKAFPVGALYILLSGGGNSTGDSSDLSLVRILIDVALKMAAMKEKYPYRCLINLQGFTPSWVPVETGHWSTQWANTSWFYEFMGMHGDDMEYLLKANPSKSCMVYYKGTDAVSQ